MLKLQDEANNLEFGFSIREPKSERDALDYILSVWGAYDGPRSLGMVYAYKMVQWLAARRSVNQ